MKIGFNEQVLPFIICPCCLHSAFTYLPGISLQCNHPGCSANKQPFEFVNNQPLLVDFSDSLFKKQDYLDNRRGEVVVRKKGWLSTTIKRVLWGDSPVSEKQVKKLVSLLANKEKPANVLIVGGGTIGLGTEAIYKEAGINIISFDVYITPYTHFVADAHSIPIANASIDAVIVQAVLEHVLNPVKVVAEIARVLKPGGLVYAETPFMQQVHEGAYDFTRFTESGHRWLFSNFELIGSGPVRGVGVSLMWSLRYFFAGLFRSQLIGTLVAACFFWLRFVEKLVPEKNNIDGGSCFYFLGRKSGSRMNEHDLIEFYSR